MSKQKTEVEEVNPKIEVDEVNLEDMILLGEDKLINIIIEYPTENGTVRSKAKIKQLTMKELKNINITKADLNVNVDILTKALFQQDNTPFSRELIYRLPVGVVNAVTHEILKISGVKKQDLGF